MRVCRTHIGCFAAEWMSGSIASTKPNRLLPCGSFIQLAQRLAFLLPATFCDGTLFSITPANAAP